MYKLSDVKLFAAKNLHWYIIDF